MPYTIQLCDDNGRAVAKRVWRSPPASQAPKRTTIVQKSTITSQVSRHNRHQPPSAKISRVAGVAKHQSVARKAQSPPMARCTTPPLQIRKGINNIALSFTSTSTTPSTPENIHHLRTPSLSSCYDSESSSSSSSPCPSTPPMITITTSDSEDSTMTELRPSIISPLRTPTETCLFPYRSINALEGEMSNYFFELEESLEDPFTLIQGYSEPILDKKEREAYVSPLDAISMMQGIGCF